MAPNGFSVLVKDLQVLLVALVGHLPIVFGSEVVGCVLPIRRSIKLSLVENLAGQGLIALGLDNTSIIALLTVIFFFVTHGCDLNPRQYSIRGEEDTLLLVCILQHHVIVKHCSHQVPLRLEQQRNLLYVLIEYLLDDCVSELVRVGDQHCVVVIELQSQEKKEEQDDSEDAKILTPPIVRVLPFLLLLIVKALLFFDSSV